uniref:Uncharacterized protein n=1 Tax=Anguilla anguilla TaxID=7936 RepID=A0A0E9XYY8_ANGAN
MMLDNVVEPECHSCAFWLLPLVHVHTVHTFRIYLFKLLINWINQTFPQSIRTISVMSFLLAFPGQQNSPFQIRV